MAVQEADSSCTASQARPAADQTPIAIIGLACIFPGAADMARFWGNILRRLNAITEVPAQRWSSQLFYNADPTVHDRVVSKWGGFIDPVPFDPLKYGVPPTSIPSIEPLQLLALEVAQQGLADAGYTRKAFPRERTATIIGTGGGACDLGLQYQTRAMAELFLHRAAVSPDVREEAIRGLREVLPTLTEDSFAGTLGNVAAGRLANRFDLGGPNFAIDAACASSLAALTAAVQELRSGNSDMVVMGGGDAQMNIFSFLQFSKTHALLPRGQCRPFDARADGIAISEGLGLGILKRLDDAERDGDRIYAVIRSVGAASDGRDKSMTAPSIQGQRRTLERAYQGLAISPASIGLVEAHGTGTVVGDATELQALHEVFATAGARPQSCALGSVKSLIGHTKMGAGMASLIKTALALHHRTLPPTLVEEPSAAARDRRTPFYLNTRTRPWFHRSDAPRRAALSGFGFGGTNFHVVLEEYAGHTRALGDRPAELFVFRGQSREALAKQLETLEHKLAQGATVRPIDLAALLHRQAALAQSDCRLAIVAGSIADLRGQLTKAAGILRSEGPFPEPGPICYSEAGSRPAGSLAFLFPGQGSQYLNMLEDLALYFPAIREVFETADRELARTLPTPLTHVVFPPPAYTATEEAEQRRTLEQTWYTQPALGAADYALAGFLKQLGLVPDLVAGHSYGEYVALCLAGTLSLPDLLRISEQRGRLIQETQGRDAVGMLAVTAPAETLTPLLAQASGVAIAARNAPRQTVLGGSVAAIEAFMPCLDRAGLTYQRLAVSAGFHIPEAIPAAKRFAEVLDQLELAAPRLPVYANRTAGPYPSEPPAIRQLLLEQMTEPVRFQEQIEAMYQAGVRTFVEVGPGQVLSGLVRQILGPDRPALILPCNRRGSGGALAELLEGVGRLYVAGTPLNWEPLFADCNLKPLEMTDLGQPAPPLSPATWMIDGSTARPLHERKSSPAAEKETRKVTAPKPLPTPAAPAEAATTPKVAATGTPATPGVGVPPSGGFETSTPPKGGTPTGAAGVPPSGGLETSTPPKGGTPTGAAGVPPSGGLETSTPPKGGTPAALPVVVPLAPAPAVVLPSSDNSSVQLMAAFQTAMRQFLDHNARSQEQSHTLMHRFLQTQTTIFQAFTQGGALPGATAPALASVALNLAAEQRPAGTLLAPPPSAEINRLSREETLPEARSNGTAYAAPERIEPPAVERAEPALLDEPVLSAKRADPIPTKSATLLSAAAAPGNEVVAELAVLPSEERAERLRQLLLELIAERTGYPSEMLELEHNMEADLGIDSIKRTEIFAGLRDRLGFHAAVYDQEETVLKLSKLRTLGEVLGWLIEAVTEAATGSAATDPHKDDKATPPRPASSFFIHPSETAPAAPGGGWRVEAGGFEDETLHPPLASRFLVRAMPTPLTTAEKRPARERELLLVTADSGGLARQMFTLLRGLGYDLAFVYHATENRVASAGHYEVDLFSRSAVRQLKQWIDQHHGPVTALCHLLPLSPSLPVDDSRCLEVRSLFLLLSTFGRDLIQAQGTVLGVTGMGGTFGADGPAGPGERRGVSPPVRPGHGAVAGFLKSLAREWPNVHIKAVDVDPTTEDTHLLSQLVAEFETTDPAVEVGYSPAGRCTLQPVESPADRSPEPTLQLEDGSVILITGGARGITAAIAAELARRGASRRSRFRLVLAGRSPPPEPEAPETVGLTTPAELKRALADRRRARGEPMAPHAIEAEYKALLRNRELLANLRRLSDLGATFSYHSLDVRDDAALAALIESIYQQHGRLDGVIHAAGILGDSLLATKTPEGFDRIFETKVKPALTLVRTLRPQSLRFLAFFSSVAARFGNAGQTDYAAANEYLNKLARQLDQEWPARVVSIGWGPWDEVGMARPEAMSRDYLASIGFAHMPVQAGCQQFWQEITHGRKGESEVLIFRPEGAGPSESAYAEAQFFMRGGKGVEVVTAEAAQGKGGDLMIQAKEPPEGIAIVGMQCLFPGAANLAEYWRNIVRGSDAIRTVPELRWRPADYDLVQATRGGFIEGLTEFDPLEHGIMPASVQDGDPEHFLVFAMIHSALNDVARGQAFCRTGVVPTESQLGTLPQRTEVVIGRGGYNGNTIERAYLRIEFVAQFTELLTRLAPGASAQTTDEIRRLIASAFPRQGTADMLAASIPNLISGRIANRLDFVGANSTVDAACASGLLATDQVVRSLREGAATWALPPPPTWCRSPTSGTPSSCSRPFRARERAERSPLPLMAWCLAKGWAS